MGERPEVQRGRSAVRRRSGRSAAGADHRDLQPHRRRLRLAGLHGEDGRADREHRNREQPLRHGPSPCCGLCRRRPPRAEGRQLAALRPQRLAQRGLSRSASVVLCLSRKNGEREKRDRRTRPLSRPHQTRYASRMAHPLSRIIEQLKREPSRTGSIVITVFGDAIVPRGGSVWLGTLLEFFESLDIDSGVVRTAMSRLAADGWLTREKVGRNSFYRLADKGRQIFEAATRHIYDPPPSGWTGRFELLLIGNGEDRDASREALRNAGFGSPLPGVWVARS